MRLAAILLTIGLAVRLAAVEYVLANGLLRFPDSELYRAYAERIADGKPYSIGNDAAQRTPGYPYFLSACWRLAGRNLRGVLWTQAVVSTATCWLVWKLTDELTAAAYAPATALTLAVFDPFAVAAAATELTECVFTALAMASVWLTVRQVGVGRANSLALFLGGLFAGAAVLVRPSLLPLAAVAPFSIVVAKSGRSFLNMGSFAIGLLLVVSPWWIRNFDRFGIFVPTTLNVGESLYDGLNHKATGASQMEFATTPQVRSMSEVDRDRHWRNEAIRWASTNLGQTLKLAGAKFCRFWSPWPNDSQFRSQAIDAATGLASVIAYVLAFLGCLRLGHRPMTVALLLAPIVYFCGLHMVFVSSVRYRVPILPLLDVLAGIGLCGTGSNSPWDSERGMARAAGNTV